MKRHLCFVISFVLLIIFSASVSASIGIILKSPSDGTSTTSYTQDFIYSFNQSPSLDPGILNCSLIVDNEVKRVRNTLFVTGNNKITITLEGGNYEWYMKCVDGDHTEVFSDIWIIHVNTGGEVKEGYETIYNYNGLRSYKFTIEPGQSPVELPAILGGEDIQIVINGKIHYLDILKMGVYVNTSFVEVRDRTSGTVHKMLIGDALTFDFDKDKKTDIGLKLVDVERNVNAFFILTPYPGTPLFEESLKRGYVRGSWGGRRGGPGARRGSSGRGGASSRGGRGRS